MKVIAEKVRQERASLDRQIVQMTERDREYWRARRVLAQQERRSTMIFTVAVLASALILGALLRAAPGSIGFMVLDRIFSLSRVAP